MTKITTLKITHNKVFIYSCFEKHDSPYQEVPILASRKGGRKVLQNQRVSCHKTKRSNVAYFLVEERSETQCNANK